MYVKLTQAGGRLGTQTPSGRKVVVTVGGVEVSDEDGAWLIARYANVDAFDPVVVVPTKTPEPTPEPVVEDEALPEPVRTETPKEPTTGGAISVADLSAGSRKGARRRKRN